MSGTIATVAVVSVLMIGEWAAFKQAPAVSVFLVGLAGYRAGHHDGANGQ